MKHNLKITEPGQVDLDSVFGILYDVTKHLISEGDFKWGSNTDSFPYNMTTAGKMISLDDVRLAYLEREKPVATFTLSRKGRWYTWKDWLEMDQGETPEAAYLSALAVRPEYQSRGIGKGICSIVEGISESNGFPLLRINTSPDLLDFYSSIGFNTVGSKKDSKGVPYILFMEKKLD